MKQGERDPALICVKPPSRLSSVRSSVLPQRHFNAPTATSYGAFFRGAFWCFCVLLPCAYM
jgi:hypothetical protein